MKTSDRGNTFVSWTLRFLLIVTIFFWGLFSLDVFNEGYNFLETVGAFLVHNIPSLLMIIVLIIAWKRENVGGALLLLLVLCFVIFFIIQSGRLMYGTLIMFGLPFLIGVMFLVNYYFLGKKQEEEKPPY
ncbi:MAG TPA: hypothetical protein ENH02_00205 [Bacteroidetes bacterium]|nr:hypothetical protein [Bacteroidota bacterium]